MHEQRRREDCAGTMTKRCASGRGTLNLASRGWCLARYRSEAPPTGTLKNLWFLACQKRHSVFEHARYLIHIQTPSLTRRCNQLYFTLTHHHCVARYDSLTATFTEFSVPTSILRNLACQKCRCISEHHQKPMGF